MDVIEEKTRNMKFQYIKGNVKYIFSTTDQLARKIIIELILYPNKPKIITEYNVLLKCHEFKLEEIFIHPELYQLGYSNFLRMIERRTV